MFFLMLAVFITMYVLLGGIVFLSDRFSRVAEKGER